jgi:hypothetical protein
MINGYDNVLKNDISKMNVANKDYIYNEIWRRGSVAQRDPSYLRNGLLNSDSRQNFSLINFDFYTIGVGGPPVVS